MMARFITWFTPPQFEDQEKTRVAGLLSLILWTLNVLLVVILVIPFFIPRADDPFPRIVFIVGSFIIFGGLIGLLRLGYVYSVARVFLGIGWLLVTGSTYQFGGVRGAGYSAFVMLILVSGLLLGSWSAIRMAVISIITGWGLLRLEMWGRLPMDEANLYLNTMFSTVTPYFIAVGIFTALYHRSFITAIARISQNEQILVRRNQQLRRLRRSLEDEVTERVRHAETVSQEAEAAHQLITEQMWLMTGRTLLSEKMRSQQDVPSLARHIVQQLCHYVEAPVGRLFVLSGDRLKLVGSYAYVPNQLGQLKPYEAFIGAGVPEKQRVIETAIPPDYLPIKSSLGEMPSTYILVQPLVYQGTILGVVELGHVTAFTSAQTNFLQSVSKDIAIAFNTAQARAHLDALLGNFI